MMQQGDEEYITVQEAAELLGVKRRTVERYAEEGRLTRYRRGVRRQVFFNRKQVETLLEIRPEDELSHQ